MMYYYGPGQRFHYPDERHPGACWRGYCLRPHGERHDEAVYFVGRALMYAAAELVSLSIYFFFHTQ